MFVGYYKRRIDLFIYLILFYRGSPYLTLVFFYILVLVVVDQSSSYDCRLHHTFNHRVLLSMCFLSLLDMQE